MLGFHDPSSPESQEGDEMNLYSYIVSKATNGILSGSGE
jgi:hypothetical protein